MEKNEHPGEWLITTKQALADQLATQEEKPAGEGEPVKERPTETQGSREATLRDVATDHRRAADGLQGRPSMSMLERARTFQADDPRKVWTAEEREEIPQALRAEHVCVTKAEEHEGIDTVTVPVKMYNTTMYALADTGATGAYMSKDAWRELGRPERALDRGSVNKEPTDAQGNVIHVMGRTWVPMNIGGAMRKIRVAITDVLQPGLILGTRPLREWCATIHLGATHNTLELDGPGGMRNRWSQRLLASTPPNGWEAVQVDKETIPVGWGKNVWMSVEGPEEGTLGVISLNWTWNPEVAVARTLARCVRHESVLWIPVPMENVKIGRAHV